MFSLKRGKSQGKTPPKRAKANAFGDNPDSENDSGSDQESKFLQSVKLKADKISTQVATQDNETYFQDDDEDEKEQPRKDNDGDLKYLKSLLKASKERKNERLVGKFQDQERNNANKEVFESELYKEQKNSVLALKREESDDEDKGSFYKTLLDTRIRGNAGENIETDEEPSMDVPSLTPALSFESWGQGRQSQEYEQYSDSEESTKGQFISKIKAFLKCTVGLEELENYKTRYLQRQKLQDN